MANYQETSVTGTKYTRAYQVLVQNGLENKSITFQEEELVNLDGTQVHNKLGSIFESFTADNANTTFDLLDPNTGASMGQGMTMTYSGVYAALYSLYMHLAVERDNAASNP